MQDTQNIVISHEAAWELLPWLVNGSLEPGEFSQVTQHANDCLLCRRELQQQRGLYELVEQSETVHISPKASFDSVMQRIDSDGRSTYKTDFGAWISAAIDRHRKGKGLGYLWSPLPAAGLVACLSLVSIVILSPTSSPDRSADFRTLSDGQKITVTGMTVLHLVFTVKTTDQEIKNIVSDLHGQLLQGPTITGVYTAQFPIDQTRSRAADELLQQLAADNRVRFAGPAFSELPEKP